VDDRVGRAVAGVSGGGVGLGLGGFVGGGAGLGKAVLVAGFGTVAVGIIWVGSGVLVALIPGVEVGDEVILWGNGLPPSEVASCAGTIGYELLCGVTSRVLFDYCE